MSDETLGSKVKRPDSNPDTHWITEIIGNKAKWFLAPNESFSF